MSITESPPNAIEHLSRHAYDELHRRLVVLDELAAEAAGTARRDRLETNDRFLAYTKAQQRSQASEALLAALATAIESIFRLDPRLTEEWLPLLTEEQLPRVAREVANDGSVFETDPCPTLRRLTRRAGQKAA